MEKDSKRPSPNYSGSLLLYFLMLRGDWHISYIPEGDDDADDYSTDDVRRMMHVVSNSTETSKQRRRTDHHLS